MHLLTVPVSTVEGVPDPLFSVNNPCLYMIVSTNAAKKFLFVWLDSLVPCLILTGLGSMPLLWLFTLAWMWLKKHDFGVLQFLLQIFVISSRVHSCVTMDMNPLYWTPRRNCLWLNPSRGSNFCIFCLFLQGGLPGLPNSCSHKIFILFKLMHDNLGFSVSLHSKHMFDHTAP